MVFAFNLKRTEKKYIIFKYFGGSIIMVLLDKGIVTIYLLNTWEITLM